MRVLKFLRMRIFSPLKTAVGEECCTSLEPMTSRCTHMYKVEGESEDDVCFFYV